MARNKKRRDAKANLVGAVHAVQTNPTHRNRRAYRDALTRLAAETNAALDSGALSAGRVA